MKKIFIKKIWKYLLIVCFAVVSGSILVPGQVKAAGNAKVTMLKKGRTYSYDLNGDKKKEKIKITYTVKNKYKSNCRRKVNFYVNGKLIYIKQLYGEPDFPVKVRLADLNTSDKYKEILVQKYDSSSTTSDFFALRYMGKKKVKVLQGMKNFKWHAGSNTKQISCYRFDFKSNTGKNEFYIDADTPYSNSYFGSYYVKIPIVLGNGKFAVKQLASYEISNRLKWSQHEYELKRGMTLYKTDSMQSGEDTYLTPGTKFKAKEIKPVNVNDNYGALYVKVVTLSGQTGWIYFPEYSRYNSGYLKDVPEWG